MRSVSTCLASAMVFAMACTMAGTAFAQSAPPADAARAAERIQREEQERQRQQFLQDQQRRGPPTSIELPPPAPAAAPNIAGCVDVRRITIHGAPHLPDADRERIVAAFVGRCLYVTDIEKILSEITRSYIERGYATARAYIQQQDISTGHLQLLVVEGVLEKILLRGDAERSVSKGNVFPGLEGQVLNLRALEQGLNQVNRLASNNATLDIAPGEAPGGSVVTIDNTVGRTWGVAITADNQGSSATGRNQLGATLNLDNPLGFNDALSITHRRSVPADAQRRQSLADTLSYGIPFGYSTVSLGWSRSRYVSSFTVPSGLELQTSGDSTQAFVRVDWLIHQAVDSRATLAATVTAKNAHNYLQDALIAVSSRKLAVADLDANYSTAALGGVLGLDLGWSQGLGTLGALRDAPGLPDEAPRAQFQKLRYGANFGLPFPLFGTNASFGSQFSGQHARDPMYGSEQISVGGIYAVRGFFENNLVGDHGLLWRNDLSLNIPVALEGGGAVLLRPYLGLDYGRARSKAPGNLEGHLAGMALGLAIAAERVSLDIFYAKGLSRPAGMPHEAGRVFVALRVRL